MRLPIVIRWRKNVEHEERARTKLFMRRNRVIVALEADNQAMRTTLQRIYARAASQKSKPPKGAGVRL